MAATPLATKPTISLPATPQPNRLKPEYSRRLAEREDPSTAFSLPATLLASA